MNTLLQVTRIFFNCGTYAHLVVITFVRHVFPFPALRVSEVSCASDLRLETLLVWEGLLLDNANLFMMTASMEQRKYYAVAGEALKIL